MDEAEQTIDLDTTGFVTMQHPGPSFRPIPSFTMEIPPTWIVDEFPDALYIIGTPADSPEPWSNCFIQHERVINTAALEEIALESWEKLKGEFRDAKVVEERVVVFEQVQYLREAKMKLNGEKITRVDAYLFGPDVDHPTVDLFHFFGLHPVSAGDDRTLTYMKMLSSLHIS